MIKDFAVFICTHGRPYKQHTYKMLRECGYTGRIVTLLDNEDETCGRYKEEGYNVTIFDKQYYIDKVDIGRSDAKRAAILYAKCACEDIAKENDLRAFVIVDDDIKSLRYRYREKDTLRTLQIRLGLDEIFQAYISFMLDCNVCMSSLGTSQIYIGGIKDEKITDLRIPYSFVFRNASIPVDWVSEMNEDTVTALNEANNGKYMLQLPFIQLFTNDLNSGNIGGMTEAYKSMSDFQRISSLFEFHPNCVRYYAVKNKVTHSIIKDAAFPKLVSSRYKHESSDKDTRKAI